MDLIKLDDSTHSQSKKVSLQNQWSPEEGGLILIDNYWQENMTSVNFIFLRTKNPYAETHGGFLRWLSM